MSAPSVLTEELGPIGKRRVRVATAVGIAVMGLFAWWVISGLASAGQFEWRYWELLVDIDEQTPQTLLRAARGTMYAAMGAMAAASILGLALALGRLSRITPLRWACGLIIDVFRGPPVLLLIYFSFFALPQLVPDVVGSTIRQNPFLALLIGLTIYHMAVLAEIFRAGILSLDRGQREAALAVGMTRGQTMRTVILPQALRRMIPTIVAQLATVTKDTSLGYIIGATGDLMRAARTISEYQLTNTLQTYFVVAMMYFVLIWVLSQIASRLETQQRRKLGAGAIEVEGEADVGALAEDAKT